MPINQASVAKQVSGHGLILPLFKIAICEHSAFEDFVEVLFERSFALEARQRRLREKTLTARRKTCVLFIDGLFQAYSSLAVSDSRNPMLKHIVAMLILTGARKREVLDAKWEDFDTERKSWRIPMSKSGKARRVPLNQGALNILLSLLNTRKSDYVFCNPDTGKPYVSFFHSWDTAREQAGLKDVRVHDLRHSFASLLVNQGRTLYEVQKILGHTQVKTTQRYAHLSHDTLLDATNSVNTALGGMFVPMVSASPTAQVQLAQ